MTDQPIDWRQPKDGWIVCDFNALPHPEETSCRNPRPPDKSIVPRLLRMADRADQRARTQAEFAAGLRELAAKLEDQP